MAEQPTQEEVEQIKQALVSGRKIEAIRTYREATGKDVKAAKDFIDELVARLIEQDPETYGKLSSKGRGCGTAVVLFAGFVAAGVACL